MESCFAGTCSMRRPSWVIGWLHGPSSQLGGPGRTCIPAPHEAGCASMGAHRGLSLAETPLKVTDHQMAVRCAEKNLGDNGQCFGVAAHHPASNASSTGNAPFAVDEGLHVQWSSG